MDKIDFICLSPLLILAGATVVIMLATTIRRSFVFTGSLTLIAFTAAFFSLFIIRSYLPHDFDPLIVVDNFGLLFLGILYISSILVTILTYSYLKAQAGEREEYFILLLVAVLGASVLVLAHHFISFFLGLEILSISLYVLTAYLKWRDICIEAGVKFLVFSSLSTAFLLFGMGLIYLSSGSMRFDEIIRAVPGSSPAFLIGTGMMLVAIGFKLALVPFHMWAADVYQGAPMPATIFVATISKGSVLALALRMFAEMKIIDNENIITVVSFVSIVTMLTGNLLALRQDNVKRLLAYSSIAHLGYLMITLVSGSSGTNAAIFYLTVYILTTLAAFGVLTALSVCERDAQDISDLVGLAYRKPWLAIVFSVAMLSFAGIPLTAGFMSKFYLVLAGAKAGVWALAVSLVINSTISLYYYLRLIRIMFTEPLPGEKVEVVAGTNLVLAFSLAGIIILGILPSVMLSIINSVLGLK
ncbi:MAG TPA: NADH-quinone oxidoreductase subunit N [Bacteroidales bacterium]|nr:NADH-quinone oxidoreductase subunit N [Bacteroidales bacterium]